MEGTVCVLSYYPVRGQTNAFKAEEGAKEEQRGLSDVPWEPY